MLRRPPDSLDPPHERELRSFLMRVRRRWFSQVVLRTAGGATAAASIVGLLALSVERLLRPAALSLVFLGALAILAAAAAASIVVWRMQRRPSDPQVARFVEERACQIPGAAPLDDAVVSAVEGNAQHAPAVFGPLLIDAAVRRLRSLTPSQIVPPAMIGRAAMEASAGTAVLVIALLGARAPLARATDAAWLTLFPQTIQVEVQPGDRRVAAGQPVEIRAIVRRGTRTLTNVIPSLVVTAGAEQRTVSMAADGEAFSFPIESVDRTFTYHVAAGAATSSEHTITALFPPRVRRIDLLYEYPGFTGLHPRLDEDAGDIYGPAGTKVRVQIHTDKPVASGELAFQESSASPLRPAADRVVETDFVLARDDSYRVTLKDGDGLQSRGDTEYFIRLMDDRPPDVRILRPAGDQQITPLEEVVIEARADDDHGIARFELVYAVPGREARTVPFGRTSGSGVTRLGAHLLAAEELRVEPGDVITYYARAVDVGRGKRPTEARSDMYFLEVRPFHEEFVAAQSQAGGSMAGAQIDSLIAAQKAIINATWNIERRSTAGRSSDDIRAVAQAQAELKGRAERMMSRGGRGRPPFEVRQQVAPPRPGRGGQPSGEGVRAAVQAMARALEQLEGERTKDALPHEMAALQGLVQVQAEIRRREVMQQQAGGGSGGSGRPGQDLSALFDKELQRQQRTNYETRSQIEQRPDQADRDGALDRIRDLARRQEDLSRRQRELAEAGSSAEEKKRHLERLTREQLELRERAEQLARQMEGRAQASAEASSREGQEGRQQGQSGGTRESGRQDDQPARAGRAANMQQVAEGMKQAAGDLTRQDLNAAAERSAAAAEQLRRIEQEMRGTGADAQARAAGELQLEAQQIAEEQRRIAAEAERMAKGTPDANADARRRLAGEKDRLADRTDALQRGARELATAQAGAGQPGTEAARVGETARDLDRQQLGQRMRETAKEMRGAGPAPVEAERQIARALDRLVEQLGGPGAETPALSNALGEAREIRERLDRLERQLRDAEAGRRGAQGGGERQQGRAEREAGRGAPAAGGNNALEKLREEYSRELQRARESLGRMEQSAPRTGLAGSTPEREERSQADPGNEGFKQDFSGWESLRKDVNLALERQEAAVSARMAGERAQDRLSGGGSERVPDAYRALIARYYEALARVKK